MLLGCGGGAAEEASDLLLLCGAEGKNRADPMRSNFALGRSSVSTGTIIHATSGSCARPLRSAASRLDTSLLRLSWVSTGAAANADATVAGPRAADGPIVGYTQACREEDRRYSMTVDATGWP